MKKNTKTKILIIALKYFPASGGTATYSYNMALGLHRQGYEVLLLAPYYRNRKIDDANSPFKIKRLRFIVSIDIFRVFFAAIQILIEYNRFKPDVVWSTTFAGCRALGLLTFIKAGLIGTVHGGGIHRRYPARLITNKFTDWLGMRFMRRAEALVTVSEYSKQIFINKLPFDYIIKKIKVIYNSLDYDETAFYTYKQSREEFVQFKNKKIILTVGRLVSAKGHDVVIKSVKLLKKKFPDLLYLIVGEGIEKESLVNLVKSEGLEDIIKFTGYVTDKELEMYYAVCDLFIMAGRWTPEFVEGFGLVYIEAGLRGKAVIGTNVGGIPEAISEGKTGYIIEPDNPEVLAERIEYLLKNDRLRKQMGIFASKMIKNKFSNEVMSEHNSNLIKDIINNKR